MMGMHVFCISVFLSRPVTRSRFPFVYGVSRVTTTACRGFLVEDISISLLYGRNGNITRSLASEVVAPTFHEL
jgi:hypothetical protein